MGYSLQTPGIGPGQSDELPPTNYTQIFTNGLLVPATGKGVTVTNYVSVTNAYINPQVRELRADCVWRAPFSGKWFTNSDDHLPVFGPMKTSHTTSPEKHRAAFTIGELLLALSIFVVCVLGIVTLQILGLKMSAIAASKMVSTASSLKTLNAIRNEVMGASSVVVGNGDSNSFTATGTYRLAMRCRSILRTIPSELPALFTCRPTIKRFTSSTRRMRW